MWTDLKAAARAGIVQGVQWGVAVLIAGSILGWAVSEYRTTRTRAANGQAAFEFLMKAQQQAAQPAAPPKSKE